MRTITFALSLLIAGCVSYSDHAWTRADPLQRSTRLLPSESLSGVKASEVEYAITLLEKADFVELDAADLARLAHRIPAVAYGEKTFLLRGVSWNHHPPFFRKVLVEESSRAVHVIGYAWNGEIFIPFQKHHSVPSPVIAALGFVPDTVIPKAVMGGDAVFMQERGAFHETDK